MLESIRPIGASALLTWSATTDGRVESLNGRWREYSGGAENGCDPHELFSSLLDREASGEDACVWHRVEPGGGRTVRLHFRSRGERSVPHIVHTVSMGTPSSGRLYSFAVELESESHVERCDVESQRFREIVEALPEMIWTASPDGEIEYCNPRFREYLGDGDARREASGWNAAWVPHFRSGRPFAAEARLRRELDGVMRWNATIAEPLRDPAGAVTHWVGLTFDVDDHKRIESNLRFLDKAGGMLAASLDARTNIARVASLVAGEFADWCIVITVNDDGEVAPAVIAHADPHAASLGWEAARRYPSRIAPYVDAVLKTGRPVLRSYVSPAELAEFAVDAEHAALLARADIRSVMSAPMMSRAKLFGCIYVVNGSSRAPFSENDLRTLEMLGQRFALAIDNTRAYERERRVADTFQRSALPQSLPTIAGASLSAVYLPARSEAEIGGDWYDAFLLDHDHLVISIGDVAGKGLEAAVLMSQMRHALRVCAYRGATPDQMLRGAHDALVAEYADHFVTAFAGVVDLRDNSLNYASAGHPSPLIRRDGGAIEELKTESPPLGVLTETPYLHTVGLRRRDMLLLFTDGVLESTRDLAEGERRMREILAADAVLRVRNPASFIRELVVSERAGDDIAILALRIDETRHWTFDARDAVAAHGARSSFIASLRAYAAPDADLAAAELIFGELIGNVVRHAPGPIDIDLSWNEEYPVLHVLDRGAGFSVDEVPPHDLVRESGRGIFIVRSLGVDLRVMSLHGRGSHVTVRLPVRKRRAK